MDSDLYKAAKSGDMESLNRLLQEKPNILVGVTPLMETVCHVALRHEQLEFAFKAYATNPMLRTWQSAKGEYLLHWALKTNKEDFFVRCIESEGSGSSSDKSFLVNKEGKSLLFLAVEMGSLRAVKSLLKSSFGTENCGPNNSTVLHAAIFQHQNDHEILRNILDKFPELINARDGDGNTPLHHVVSSKKEENLLRILQDDSTAYILNNAGLAPIHLSASLGELQVFERLLELSPESVWLTTGRDKNVLHVAVEAGKINIAQAIIERPGLKELLYEKDEDGNTCLHMAASIGDQDMQQIVIKMEEDSTMTVIKNGEGLTVEELQERRREREREKKITEISAKRKSRMGRLNIILVADTLLVTAAYNAVFNVPGGFGDDGTAVLTRSSKFITFMILNTLTFSTSIVALCSAVCCLFAYSGPAVSYSPANTSFFLLYRVYVLETSELSMYECALWLTGLAYYFLVISYAFGVMAMAGKVVQIKLLIASGYVLPLILNQIIYVLVSIITKEDSYGEWYRKFRNR